MTTDRPVGVPWYRYAAKALAALAVGVLAAAGVITAAVADGQVTLSEWWAITAAVLGAVVGPGVVFGVTNQPSARQVAARAALTLLDAPPKAAPPPPAPLSPAPAPVPPPAATEDGAAAK